MPAGGTLRIETRMLAEDRVGLIVSDTGVGMDPAILQHAFEPFYTTKDTGQGTGLGLATVYGIVEQSGGEIIVDSEPGRGTAFTVSLPAEHAAAGARAVPAQEAPERLGGDETVLVCEDEEGVRRLVEHILASNGYQLLVAALPSEALRLAADHDEQIDALVTDVIMPEMPGPELAERVQALRPGLRTVFVSGYTAETLRDRGRLPQGSAFVQKPFEAATLLRTLRGLLDS
jgi:CheY-like chemotaxis protein